MLHVCQYLQLGGLSLAVFRGSEGAHQSQQMTHTGLGVRMDAPLEDGCPESGSTRKLTSVPECWLATKSHSPVRLKVRWRGVWPALGTCARGCSWPLSATAKTAMLSSRRWVV